MSTTIDRKVVEMSFDNSNFEKNVSQSMSTLDKLKEKLNFSDASTFEELSAQASRVDFSPLSSAVGAVGDKFGVLEQIAIGALRNIGAQAAELGTQFIKSLTTDNIAAGWEKFGNKTNAVSTLVAQGYDISTVEEQLEKLNFFTDETSYNFTDMVSEIGKFTAAGQNLEDSVTAMEGIATWAALSGQNAQTASRAMYQLSQAMGSGVMRKEDYKSIQNASMDTQEFRQRAIDAALALGTLEEVSEGVYKSISFNPKNIEDAYFTIDQFADHLTKDAWFTKDVMMSVYTDYGKAATGIQAFMDAFDIDTASSAMTAIESGAKEAGKSIKEYFVDTIIENIGTANEIVSESEIVDFINEYNSALEEGETPLTNYAEALDLMGYGLDEFSIKAFKSAQEARTWTDVIDSVKDAVSTGWMNTFENVFGNYEESKKLWTDLANELYDVFAAGGDARNEMLSSWKELGGRDLLFANTDEQTGAFWNLFYALKDVINAVKEAFSEIFPPMTAERLLELTNNFKTFTENLRMNDEELDKFKTTLTGIFSGLKFLGNVIIAVVKGFSPLKPVLDAIRDAFLSVIGAFSNWGKAASDNADKLNTYENITSKVAKVVQVAANVMMFFINVIKSLAKAIAGLVTGNKDGIEDFSSAIADKFSNLSTIASKVVERFKGLGVIFKTIFDVIKPILKSIGEAIGNTIDQIADSFKNADGTLDLEAVSNTILTFLSGGALVAITKFINNLKSGFGFTDVIESISGVFSSLSETLNAATFNLNAEALSKIAKAILILVAALFVLTLLDPEKLKNAASIITVMFVDLIGSFKILQKGSGEIKSGQITAIGFALGEMSFALLILAAAMKIIEDISWEGIGKSLSAFAVCLQLLPAALNNTQAKGAVKKAFAMILLTTSLVILGAAMKNIAGMTWEGIGKSLAAFAVCIQILPAALNNTETKGAVKKAFAMILLTTSLVILGAAMKNVADMSWEELGKSLAAFAICLQLLPAALNNTETKGAVKKAFAMILLTTSLVILGAAMKNIASMSWDGVGKSLSAFAVCLYLLPTALNNTETKGAIKKALSMILLTTSLLILGNAMKNIADISWEGLGKSLAAFAVCLYLLPAALNNVGTKGAIKKALSMILLTASLLILGNAMKNIADISWDGVAKSLISMTVAMAVLAGTAVILGKANSGKGAAALIVLAGALLLISNSLTILSKISWQGLLVGLGGLVATLLILGVASKLLAPLTGSMLSLALSITAFSLSMALFGVSAIAIGAGLMLIGSGLKLIGSALSAFIVDIAELMSALFESLPSLADSIIKNAPIVVEAITVFISSILAVIRNLLLDIISTLVEIIKAVVVSLLEVIRDCLPDIVSTLLETIVVIITNLAEQIPQIVAVLLELIVNVLDQLVENLPTIVSKLFAIIIGILQALVEYAPQLTDLLINLIINFISGLTNRIPDVLGAAVDLLSALFDGLVTAIGELIGNFIGSIVNGIATAIVDGLPKIGEKLSQFSESIAPFLDMASGISEDSMKGIKLLAETILIITAAELLSSLTDFMSFFGGSSSSKFGETIVTFGKSIAEFAEETKDVDGAKVESSANAAKALAEFASSLPKEGGLWQDFFGTGDLTKFGEELESFAPHFVSYANTVADIKDTEAVKMSADAALSLANFANNLPKHGGEWQKFFGDSSLTTFATELEDFAPALVSYSKQVSGMDTSAVEISISAAQALSNFADNLPKHNGIWQSWVGDSSLTSFANELKSFAPSLVDYSNTVSGLNTEAITASAAAAQMLSTLESNLPDTGGVVSWFAGDNTLEGFSKGLPVLGKALHDYVANLGSDFDTNKATAAATAASALGSLESGLSDRGGLVSLFAGDNTLKGFSEGLPVLGQALHDYVASIGNVDVKSVEGSTKALESLSKFEAGLSNSGGLEAFVYGDNTLAGFGKSMETFGKGVKSFYDNVKDIETGEISAIIDSLLKAVDDNKSGVNNKFKEIATLGVETWKEYYPTYKNIGKFLIENLISGMETDTDTVPDKMSETVRNTISSITKYYSNFKLSGTNAIDNFKTGLSDGKEKVDTAIKTVLDSMTSSIKNGYDDVKQSGSYAVQGLINAVTDMTPKAKEAGATIAKSLASGIEVSLKIASPSKVTYGLGEYAAQGFLNALYSSEELTRKAGSEVGESATGGIRDALSKSASLFDTTIDVEPTIRPVLDLSDINNGVGTIDEMFDKMKSIELAEDASIKMAGVNGNIQNEIVVDNSDVVNELENLRQDMANMSDRISRLQVVMDTGALVGTLATPMDNALGTRAARYGREWVH